MMAFVIIAAIIAVIVLGTRIERGDSLQEQDAEGGKMIEVSLEVRCDALSGDLSKLKKAEKESYVPSDGVILEETVVEVSEDSSVYDVLYQVCKEQDIHMEASYTPGSEKAYVEGIILAGYIPFEDELKNLTASSKLLYYVLLFL